MMTARDCASLDITMAWDDPRLNYQYSLVAIAREHEKAAGVAAGGPHGMQRQARANAGSALRPFQIRRSSEIAPGPRAMMSVSSENHRMCSGQPLGNTKS